MAWSRDPRKPTRYMRGSKRYNDVGGHSPPGDELENTRDHERIWFELKRNRSCCDCDSPGFKYCFDTFDYPSYICDGEFPGGDTLVGFWPGVRKVIGLTDGVDSGCQGADLTNLTFSDLTAHPNGSWRNGPFVTSDGAELDMVTGVGWNWNNRFPSTAWTLEFWLKPTASDIDTGASIIKHGIAGDSLSQGGLDVSLGSDGSIQLSHIQIASGADQASGAGWFEADQWHHVAVVRNTVAQTIAIFVNGRIAIGRILPTTGWSVGTFPATPTFVFAKHGSYSDIAAYTSALSPTVLRRHYQAVYGVEGAANPLSSVEGNPGQVEDPTQVITEQISIDLIGGGGDAQAGYVSISQGDYAAWVSPEDSPFELEERKGQPDGYAGLDSAGHVPTAQLGSGTADVESYLRGDQTYHVGQVVPKPVALGQMLRADPATSDEYVAQLPITWPSSLAHWALTQSASPWPDNPTSGYGDLATEVAAPDVSSSEPVCFSGESYLVFDGTKGLRSTASVSGPEGRFQFGLWIRLTELPASTVNLIRFDDRCGARVLSDGTIQLWGDALTLCTSTVSLPVGEWAHVVFADDGAGAGISSKIWINGVPAGTGSGFYAKEFVNIFVAGDGLACALSHISFSGVEIDGSGTATDATVLALYETRRPVWTLIDEVTGGGGSSGIDASEDSAPVTAAPRSRVNFIPGSNVTIDVVDDSGGDEIEVTIAATAPAGSGIEVSDNDADVSASPRGRINFLDGTGTTVVTADDGANDEVEVRVDVDQPLPDPSGETDGDVLTIASGAWVVSTPAAGGGGADLTIDVNQVAHGFSVGDVIRRTSGSYTLSQADASANAEVDGIVTAVADVDNFTFAFAGEITGLSGLTDGVTYFLSAATAGALTATEPSTTGEVSKPILRATGSTTGIFINWRGAIVQ